MTSHTTDGLNKRAYLRGMLERAGITCRTYSPGDGVTRYRFFAPDDPSEYFGPSSGLGTALGIGGAITRMEGYLQGRYQGMRLVNGENAR